VRVGRDGARHRRGLELRGGITDCGTSVSKDLSGGADWCANATAKQVITDYDDWGNITDSALNRSGWRGRRRS